MTLSHHHDAVFDIPLTKKVRRPRKARADAGVLPYRDPDSVLACEFSALGRDRRYPSGWYIFPALALALLMLGFLLA